jgi:hypothetical protein
MTIPHGTADEPAPRGSVRGLYVRTDQFDALMEFLHVDAKNLDTAQAMDHAIVTARDLDTFVHSIEQRLADLSEQLQLVLEVRELLGPLNRGR